MAGSQLDAKSSVLRADKQRAASAAAQRLASGCDGADGRRMTQHLAAGRGETLACSATKCLEVTYLLLDFFTLPVSSAGRKRAE